MIGLEIQWRSDMRRFGAGVLLLLAGCSSFCNRPDNQVVPTLSFTERIKKYTQSEKVRNEDQWVPLFRTELMGMDGWAPPQQWFTKSGTLPDAAMEQAALEYGFRLSTKYVEAVSEKFTSDDSLGDIKSYFRLDRTETCQVKVLTKFFPQDQGLTNSTLPLRGRSNLARRAVEMLTRIDEEHETLLLANLPSYTDRGPSPRMVSRSYPVGVSVSRVYPEDQTNAKTGGSAVPPAKVNTNAAQGIVNNIMVNSTYTAGNGTNKAGPATTSKPPTDDNDFKPDQDVTLTLSAALNSADGLDRIDYVSTYISIYPYPSYSDSSVSLETEFWRYFFSLQSQRLLVRGEGRGEGFANATNSIETDLREAFESMQVNFRNVKTTAVAKDEDLGTVTRGTEDSLAATIAATIPVAPASVTPNVSMASKETSQTQAKLVRQIEQLATYLSPDARFLRITERGMINANVPGRYNEQVTLHIPAASEPLLVIQAESVEDAGKTNKEPDGVSTNVTPQTKEIPSQAKPTVKAAPQWGLRIRSLARPLYRRVDAIVVSVAVVRHPTKLRRSHLDMFGLSPDDAADTDFIVGLPRPSRITLWTSPVTLDGVYAKELDPGIQDGNEQLYFDSPSAGIYEPAPVRLSGFDDTTLQLLQGEIARAIRAKAHQAAETAIPQREDPFPELRVVRDPDPSTNGGYFIVLSNTTSAATIRLGTGTPDSKVLRSFSTEFFPSQPTDP